MKWWAGRHSKHSQKIFFDQEDCACFFGRGNQNEGTNYCSLSLSCMLIKPILFISIIYSIYSPPSKNLRDLISGWIISKNNITQFVKVKKSYPVCKGFMKKYTVQWGIKNHQKFVRSWCRWKSLTFFCWRSCALMIGAPLILIAWLKNKN